MIAIGQSGIQTDRLGTCLVRNDSVWHPRDTLSIQSDPMGGHNRRLPGPWFSPGYGSWMQIGQRQSGDCTVPGTLRIEQGKRKSYKTGPEGLPLSPSSSQQASSSHHSSTHSLLHHSSSSLASPKMAGGSAGPIRGNPLRTGFVQREYLWAFILVTSLFFLWGFAYGLLDVLNK